MTRISEVKLQQVFSHVLVLCINKGFFLYILPGLFPLCFP